jgi:MFS family permease
MLTRVVRAYLRLLKNRPFAALWAGSTVSLMGDALTWVALVWIVLDLTGSAADVGLLVIAYTAPVLMGGFVMGAALDRFDRRRLLIVANAVLGGIVLSVPIASAFGALAVWQLYAVAAAYGLLKMANRAGVPSIVPSLVPEADLNTANALESVSFGLADVGGPGVAGALIAVFGAATVLVVDGASYAIFIAFLLGLRIPAPEPELGAHGESGARRGLDLKPALRFLRRTPPVLATTLMFMAFNVGEGMILVLVPIYARRGLGAGAATYGAMLSTFALAALVGSAVVGALRWRRRLGRSIAVSQALAGVPAQPSRSARRARAGGTVCVAPHHLGADAAHAADPRRHARPGVRRPADPDAIDAPGRRSGRGRAALQRPSGNDGACRGGRDVDPRRDRPGQPGAPNRRRARRGTGARLRERFGVDLRLQRPHIRQVPELLRVVEPVAHDEHGGDLESHVSDVQVHLLDAGLPQQRRDLERRRLPRGQVP